ncbi:hypothetical protein SARC_15327, partial [Sphaeroforma arctica JP610]
MSEASARGKAVDMSVGTSFNPAEISTGTESRVAKKARKPKSVTNGAEGPSDLGIGAEARLPSNRDASQTQAAKA